MFLRSVRPKHTKKLPPPVLEPPFRCGAPPWRPPSRQISIFGPPDRGKKREKQDEGGRLRGVAPPSAPSPLASSLPFNIPGRTGGCDHADSPVAGTPVPTHFAWWPCSAGFPEGAQHTAEFLVAVGPAAFPSGFCSRPPRHLSLLSYTHKKQQHLPAHTRHSKKKRGGGGP